MSDIAPQKVTGGRQAKLITLLVSIFFWIIAILMLVNAAFLVMVRTKIIPPAPTPLATRVIFSETQSPVNEIDTTVVLPQFLPASGINALTRDILYHTIAQNRQRTGVVEYTVQKGDSVFSISNKYKLKPETVLWANYDLLDDNPNMLSIGQVLKILPADGIWYKWNTNDTIDAVANTYRVTPQAILSWPPNKLDLTNPVIKPDTYILIPGGWRENRQWLVPTVWRSGAGASRKIQGPGSCDIPDGGAMGSGSFVWPTVDHYLSGNDYWSGHLGIDIAAATGAPVYAVDSGVVVYSGSIGGGYGLMVMIDHGNGYHSLYAHLSQLVARCGQSVSQGQTIAYSGSTGNSTGPHLHFEIRYNGGFIDPWYVLP